MKPGAALTVGTTWLSSIDLAASVWSGSILTETSAAYIGASSTRRRSGLGHCVLSSAPAPQRSSRTASWIRNQPGSGPPKRRTAVVAAGGSSAADDHLRRPSRHSPQAAPLRRMVRSESSFRARQSVRRLAMLETRVDEIADGIFRFSTLVPDIAPPVSYTH